MMKSKILFSIFIGLSFSSFGQKLYEIPANTQSKVISFENPTGEINHGGKENRSAKGHPFEIIKSGEKQILLNLQSSGIIQRIWCTLDERSPEILRAIRIQFFWENSDEPAVDVPLGDFFGVGLGKMASFESSLFSSPEGRSFNCLIPMPFKKAAKIIIINESTKNIKLFYEIDLIEQEHSNEINYFHAYWSRQMTSELKKDFEILPETLGKGRFLGANIGVIVDSAYSNTWWGEGEVKMYIDGDTDFPTINGTGTEDYIGTGWGMNTYHNQFQGCLLSDGKKGCFTFYRYHIPDAIYFKQDIRVQIQQIGGGELKIVRELLKKNVKLDPITISGEKGFIKLYECTPTVSINDPEFTKGWVNFYRIDDYSATAYFYLDKPVHHLPALPNVEYRIKGLLK